MMVSGKKSVFLKAPAILVPRSIILLARLILNSRYLFFPEVETRLRLSRIGTSLWVKVAKVLRGLKVARDHKAFKVLRVARDHRVPRVAKDHKVLRVVKDLRVLKVVRDLRVLRVAKVLKVLRELKVARDRRVARDHRELRVARDPWVRLVLCQLSVLISCLRRE